MGKRCKRGKKAQQLCVQYQPDWQLIITTPSQREAGKLDGASQSARRPLLQLGAQPLLPSPAHQRTSPTTLGVRADKLTTPRWAAHNGSARWPMAAQGDLVRKSVRLRLHLLSRACPHNIMSLPLPSCPVLFCSVRLRHTQASRGSDVTRAVSVEHTRVWIGAKAGIVPPVPVRCTSRTDRRLSSLTSSGQGRHQSNNHHTQ
jgi:hypothetical protein